MVPSPSFLYLLSASVGKRTCELCNTTSCSCTSLTLVPSFTRWAFFFLSRGCLTAPALAVTAGVGIHVGGQEASRREDHVGVGPASGATGNWAARNTEAVVGFTTSTSGLLGTDSSCGGCCSDLAERDFDEEHPRFADGSIIHPRTVSVCFHVYTDSRSGDHS